MVKIFVGNVASATTEAELRALFEQHGTVSDCDILKNYGFVHMDEEDAAQKAVAALHKHVLNGSRITVEYATTKVRNATKIYVGNVPEGVTAAKIKELFQPFGKVVELTKPKMAEGRTISPLLPITIHPTHTTTLTTFPHALRPATTIRLVVDFHLLLSLHRLPVPTMSARRTRGAFGPDPYAAASSRYYERDPYERRLPPPQRPLSPPLASRYYRERSPLGSRRSLLPPPPPPPSSAGYARSYARSVAGSAPPPPPPPPPPSSASSSHYQRYSLGSGFDKDEYLDDKYSNGFGRGY
ncbi:hypothetical protein MHYP_G00212930 [Metynnis hypsauchen]